MNFLRWIRFLLFNLSLRKLRKIQQNPQKQSTQSKGFLVDDFWLVWIMQCCWKQSCKARFKKYNNWDNICLNEFLRKDTNWFAEM